ncbi:MAG TPA: NADPH:quinone oxidoreductase family protein [Thermoleophilaceae bacterium]
MRAIQLEEFGGPDGLRLVELPDPEAPEGAAVLDVSAAGVNYGDVMQTDNEYLVPATLPTIPGQEVVGTAPDGRRVVAMVDGGYAEKAVAFGVVTWDVPDAISDGQALAVVAQGTTAWHILRTSAGLREGETVVVHAAAGGVGSMAVQLARRFGAGRVVGLASTPEKRELVLRLGADAVVDPAEDDLTGALREANEGRRVDVVLETVGGRAFEQSLEALAPFGRLVHFGRASGEPSAPVDPDRLFRMSQSVIGFWLVHMLRRPDLIAEAIVDLFGAIEAGEIEPVVGGTYPLAEARRAHEDVRARRSTGKLVLVP